MTTKNEARRLRRLSDPEWAERERSYTRKWRRSEAGRDWRKVNDAEVMRSPRGRFRYCKAQAKSKGRTWGLSLDEFCKLIALPCTYCGGVLPETSFGLDRIDNSVGYIPTNVNPCCSACNYARRDFFTVEEMKSFIGPAIAAAMKFRRNNVEVSS